jgi:Protein of unknown function (DUF3551)
MIGRIGMQALAAAMWPFIPLLAGSDARAETEYPYCQGRQGFISCGYATLAQCRETVSGDGGWCQANPYYMARQAPAGEDRSGRRSRRQPRA